MKLEHHKSKKSDGTPIEWTENTFEAGEQVWIVYGHLIVKCTVVKIDDYFRKQNKDAYLFYDVDEPIGHSLAEYEMFTDPINAAKQLHRDFPEFLKDPDAEDLDTVREDYMKFISGTHGDDAQESYNAMKADLTDKKHLEDWFTYPEFIRFYNERNNETLTGFL